MNKRVINNFEIQIGSSNWDRIPFLMFIIDERFVTIKLKDFAKMIDTIIKSKGDRNENAYKAFDEFKQIFHELLEPYINYSDKNVCE